MSDVAPEATPVVAQTPSSQKPESVFEKVEAEAVSLVEAAKNLVVLVKQHRKAGDVEVSQAVDAVQTALDAQDAAQA